MAISHHFCKLLRVFTQSVAAWVRFQPLAIGTNNDCIISSYTELADVAQPLLH